MQSAFASATSAHGKLYLLGTIASGSTASVCDGILTQGDGREINVAVKWASCPHDGGFRRRVLQREGEVLSRLSHPGIVRLHASAPLGAHGWYLVLDRIRGRTLKHVARTATPTVPAATSYVQQLLHALAYVHAGDGLWGCRGRPQLLHGDISPYNVMLEDEGRVKLIDFGFACRPSRAAGARAGGTPGYVAPEAALGFGCDERAEVFSCGAILFELLTGAPVYSGSSKTELVRRAKQGPRRVEVGLDGLDAPQALKEVCVRALSPRANDRFQSVAEFAHALGGAGCVAAGTPRGRRAERPWAPFGRERGLEVSQER